MATNNTAATAADFTRWALNASKMTSAQLQWSAADAREAAEAVESYAPTQAGKYLDEAMTYEQELKTRDEGAE